MRRAVSRLTASLAAVVTMAALASCGAGGGVLEATRVPTDAVQPSATPAFLAQSAERTVAVETGKVEVEITAAGGTVSITGQFDTTRPAGAATLRSEGFADGLFGDVSAEVVYDGGVLYVKPDGLGALLGATTDKPWLKLDLGADERLGELLPGGVPFPQVEPQQLLDELQAEGIEVTEVGTEDVRGVATTHYSITAPPDTESRIGVDGAVADVWIDSDGLVRRIEAKADGGAAVGDEPVTLRAELYDLGAPVSITVPPADQVADLGPLGELFGNRPR